MNFLKKLLGLAKKADLDGTVADCTKPIHPNDAVFYYNRGLSKGTRVIPDLDGAIEDFTKAIELQPDFVDAYQNRGNAKQAKGELDGSIADYAKIIAMKPDCEVAYCHRGVAKYKKGDCDGSVADCTRAIELRPTFVDAYFYRGVANQSKGNVDAAIADYTKVIDRDLRHVAAYHNRGKAKQAQGDLDGAIADYTEALELRPDLESASINRDLARKAKGEISGANSDRAEANKLKAGPSVLRAVIDKHPTLALDLLREGGSFDEKGQYGNVALHYSAAYGYLDVIEAILQAGGTVDAKNSEGQTPLVFAMMEGQPAAARLLWEHQSSKFSESGTGKLIKELCSIGVDWSFEPGEASSGFFQKGSPLESNYHPRARQIGDELHRIGGIEAMRDANASIAQILGGKAASNLSCIWSGVGDWLD